MGGPVPSAAAERELDLLECPSCAAAFVVAWAGSGDGWICRHCHSELRLRARRVDAGRAPGWLPGPPPSLTEVPPSAVEALLRPRLGSLGRRG